MPDTGASTVVRLGDAPLAARDALLARLTAPADYAAPRSLPAAPVVSAARLGA